MFHFESDAKAVQQSKSVVCGVLNLESVISTTFSLPVIPAIAQSSRIKVIKGPSCSSLVFHLDSTSGGAHVGYFEDIARTENTSSNIARSSFKGVS